MELRDNLGLALYETALVQGYEEAIKRFKTNSLLDKIMLPELPVLMNSFNSIYKAYEEEFEQLKQSQKIMPIHKEVEDHYIWILKVMYVIIKSFHHLRLVYPSARDVADDGSGTLEVKEANEILCWGVLIRSYSTYITKLDEYAEGIHDSKEKVNFILPPFCDNHFKTAEEFFRRRVFHSRIKLHEVSLNYIALQFDYLYSQHRNIAHDKTPWLLNQSGFFTFLTYWSNRNVINNDANDALLHLINLDIDHFGKINKDKGFEEGDNILRILTERIARVCEKYGGYHHAVAGRVGGEEFWIALVDSPSIATAYKRSLLDIEDVAVRLKEEFWGVERPGYLTEAQRDSKLDYIGYHERMTFSGAGMVVPLSHYDDGMVRPWFDYLDTNGITYVKKVKKRNDFKVLEYPMP